MSEVAAELLHAVLVVDRVRPEVWRTYQHQDRVHFRFTQEEISLSGATPNWQEVEVLGRSEPFQLYASTGAEQFNIEFWFFAQGDHPNDTIPQAIDREVLRNVRFLQSLKFPIYKASGMSTPPATCWLIVGNLIRARVICQSAEPTYMEPWEPSSYLPYQAKVNCVFAEVNVHPKEASDVLHPAATHAVPAYTFDSSRQRSPLPRR